MTLSIHLNFDGSCAEALKFYESRLGGKIAFQMTWGESPMAATLPADWAKKIIHATFDVNGRTFSAADAPPGQYQRPQGFSVALDVASVGGLSQWEQVLTYALAAWFAALDGVISTSEHETMVAIGDKLGLDEPLRARAAAAANDMACLPGAGRPERYDFVKLVARLHERLPQLAKDG